MGVRTKYLTGLFSCGVLLNVIEVEVPLQNRLYIPDIECDLPRWQDASVPQAQPVHCLTHPQTYPDPGKYPEVPTLSSAR